MIQGKLYLVPTPIGNLEDVTFRAIRVLGEVRRILAEDTRRTRILCDRYGITTPMSSLTEHNTRQRLPSLLQALAAGEDLALVADAGMPGICDPGEPLVREAIARGITIEVLPGPSALVTALAGSGLSTGRFLFAGFPPRTEGARRACLKGLEGESGTALFYESPHRLAALLRDIATVLGAERRVVVARELSKVHETYHRGSAEELAAFFRDTPPKGEVVVLVAGTPEAENKANPEEARRLLCQALSAGHGVSRAAAEVAATTGLPRRQLYTWALAIRAGEEPGSTENSPPTSREPVGGEEDDRPLVAADGKSCYPGTGRT
ncbi:MAG: 16S rRNA (cytidine(1402)-2'-O)-methyltransferase [Magnetococcales bacterium]|nr:16S rRNA (cytidine(1402)-2'-O)-methyltransferase [Magnetococcales bacterium]